MGKTGKVKLVGVAFAVHFGHDVLVVIIAQCTTQFVVVHVGLAFAFTPASGHLIRVYQFKFAVRALPGDTAGIVAV